MVMSTILFIEKERMQEIRDISGKLLATVYLQKGTDVKRDRLNLSPQSELLQVACIVDDKDRRFSSHRHRMLERRTKGTQEVWIVMRGAVEFVIRDENKDFKTLIELEAGDLIITYCGYHSYNILKDNTWVYEVKNGPYYGAGQDKEYLNG